MAESFYSLQICDGTVTSFLNGKVTSLLLPGFYGGTEGFLICGFVLGMVLCWAWFCADPDDLQAALEGFSSFLLNKPDVSSKEGGSAWCHLPGSGGSFHAQGCDPAPGHCSQPWARLQLHPLLHGFVCGNLSSGEWRVSR